MPAQPQCSSSLSISSVRKSRPWPPYSSGRKAAGRQAELVRLLDDLVRKLLGLVVVSGDRPDLALGELVRELADRLLLRCQREIERHPSLPYSATALVSTGSPRWLTASQLELAGATGSAREGDDVARHDHAGEPAVQASQPLRPARRLGRDRGRNAHLEHAVRDDAGQPDRRANSSSRWIGLWSPDASAYAAICSLVNVTVALGHERITNSARDRQMRRPSAVRGLGLERHKAHAAAADVRRDAPLGGDRLARPADGAPR